MTGTKKGSLKKFMKKLPKSPSIIHDNLVKVYGEAAYSNRNLERWVSPYLKVENPICWTKLVRGAQ
jgi:hypothetical protein